MRNENEISSLNHSDRELFLLKCDYVGALEPNFIKILQPR